MEESPQHGKSKQEKNSLTATNSNNRNKKSKAELKVLNFSSREEIKLSQDKLDIMDLLSLATIEVETGSDIEVSNANCGIVILANADGDTIESSSITIYTTQSSPIKLVGILEFVKNQILDQS